MTKKICFLDKWNLTLSYAAEVIGKQLYPDVIFFSAAKDLKSYRRVCDRKMVEALEDSFYVVTDDARPTVYINDIIEMLPEFDEVHDLDREGIADPAVTGNYHEAIIELEDYITEFVDNEG